MTPSEAERKEEQGSEATARRRATTESAGARGSEDITTENEAGEDESEQQRADRDSEGRETLSERYALGLAFPFGVCCRCAALPDCTERRGRPPEDERACAFL